MSNFADMATIFEATFDSSSYFESSSAESTKHSLIHTIQDGKTPLIFLLGEPGVGKTYMLNLLQTLFNQDKKILFTSEPFSTPESFLYFLLQDKNLDKRLNISELKQKALESYSCLDNLIIIDEAQLINETVLEFIRTLSDSNHFNFLLSMHKTDGEKILKKPHFLSRTHHVVKLGILEKREIAQYIKSQLSSNNFNEFTDLFNKKHIKYIEKLSEGNFRIIKQILKHTFLIMEYAKAHGHIKYSSPNNCVITMSAIDLGIIDA